MSRKALPPSGLDSSVFKPCYVDAFQKNIEDCFVVGDSRLDLAKKFPDHAPLELTLRYDDIEKQYDSIASDLTEKWSKREIAKIIKQAHDRCTSLSTQIKKWEAKGTFPDKLYKELREEQKFLYKICVDIRKDYSSVQKPMAGAVVMEASVTETTEGRTLRQMLKETRTLAQSLDYDTKEEEETDILASMTTEEDMFGDEDD